MYLEHSRDITLLWLKIPNFFVYLLYYKYAISDTSSPLMVTDGSNEVFQVTSDLTIMSFAWGDTGVYSCIHMYDISETH